MLEKESVGKQQVGSEEGDREAEGAALVCVRGSLKICLRDVVSLADLGTEKYNKRTRLRLLQVFLMCLW